MKTSTRTGRCKSRPQKPEQDLCQVAEPSQHIKPGYQNFKVNFQIPSVSVPSINDDHSLETYNYKRNH